MMRTLTCKDLGTKTCDYTAQGSTDAEVKRKMMEHAAKDHPEAVRTAADKDALGKKIDRVLERKGASGAEGGADTETHGAHGRYGMEEEREDASQGSEFLDDDLNNEDESPRGGRARESRAVQHARGAEDASESRRDADRDAETRRTGEDLR